MKTFLSQVEKLAALRSIFHGTQYERVRTEAHQNNEWFTPPMIDHATHAICCEMLDTAKLRNWLGQYERPADFRTLRVGIIAAGNIPLVGFLDLLCAVAVGHSVTLKPSSKDRPLMEYVASMIDADIDIVSDIDRYDVDLLIGTGSDSTVSSVAQKYAGIPMILRGSRHSLGMLHDTETPAQIRGLNDDLFLYWGMGCRNISHLFLPRNYDLQPLVSQLHAPYCEPFEKKVLYERAMAKMRGEQFIDGGTFLLKEQDSDVIPPMGVVGYSYYDNVPQFDTTTVQCTVGMPFTSSNVPFGHTQTPTLTHYPDEVDVISFLIHK